MTDEVGNNIDTDNIKDVEAELMLEETDNLNNNMQIFWVSRIIPNWPAVQRRLIHSNIHYYFWTEKHIVFHF